MLFFVNRSSPRQRTGTAAVEWQWLDAEKHIWPWEGINWACGNSMLAPFGSGSRELGNPQRHELQSLTSTICQWQTSSLLRRIQRSGRCLCPTPFETGSTLLVCPYCFLSAFLRWKTSRFQQRYCFRPQTWGKWTADLIVGSRLYRLQYDYSQIHWSHAWCRCPEYNEWIQTTRAIFLLSEYWPRVKDLQQVLDGMIEEQLGINLAGMSFDQHDWKRTYYFER